MARRATIQLKVHGQIVQSMPLVVEGTSNA